MIDSRSVLIISTDTALATAYTNALGGRGHRIDTITPGPMALNHALKTTPDLIILDYMGSPGNFDLIDIIKETPETSNTRMMVLLPLVDPTTRQRLSDLGVHAVEVRSIAATPRVAQTAHRLIG